MTGRPRRPPVSVADLRAMVVAARPEVIAAGADTQLRMELSHELRSVLAALEPERPDLGPVRDHWKRVRSLLGPAAGAGRIALVTDLLMALLWADSAGPVSGGWPGAGPPRRT